MIYVPTWEEERRVDRSACVGENSGCVAIVLSVRKGGNEVGRDVTGSWVWSGM